MRILFHDASSAHAYDAELMQREAVGGTESTVVRIAQGLAGAHEVAVAQRGRERVSAPMPGLRYVPIEDAHPFGAHPPDRVIVVRKHRAVPVLRAQYPSARFDCWIHNWQRFETVFRRAGLVRSRCSVLAVSEALRAATDRLLNGAAARAIGALGGGGGRIPVTMIHNPVVEDLRPDATPVDRDKLVCFSNKGTHQVLALFAEVRRALPTLRLYMAGTSDEAMQRHGALARQPGVHLLGRLPQHEVFRHVRESLCVFYPQHVHAETFGLVLAESNAMGTPVLAHDFGAAREVLGGEAQLVDGTDRAAVIARLREWHAGGRPAVTLRPELRLSHVLGQWRQMLEGPR